MPEINVVALVGDISLSDVSKVTDREMGDEWILRRGRPTTPNSSVRGFKDRKRNIFVLGCGAIADLRRAAMMLSFEGFTSRMEIVVKSANRSDLLRTAISTFAGANYSYSLSSEGLLHVVMYAQTPVIDVSMACLSLLRLTPTRSHGYRVGIEGPALLDWVDTRAKALVGKESLPEARDVISPCDLFLVASEGSKAHPGYLGSDAEQGTEVRVVNLRDHPLQPVSVQTSSPIGFNTEPHMGSIRLRIEPMQGSVWVLAGADKARVARSRLDHGLDEAFIGKLRPYRFVELAPSTKASASHKGRLLANLAAAGVPTVGAAQWETTGLHDEVRQLLTSLSPKDFEDDLARQVWSVDIRRRALKYHESSARWSEVLREEKLPVIADASVSVTISSRRPSKLRQLFGQLAKQTYPATEILVGLHGYSHTDIDADVRAIAEGLGVNFREFDGGLVLGDVLQRLYQQSEGDYVAKMDDDDFYSPFHLQDLVAAAQYSQADLVGAKAEFVYLEALNVTTQRRPLSEQFNRNVTGGTILVRQEVMKAVGGWRLVPTAEDRLLVQAVQNGGGHVYRTHGLNYIMSRGDGHRQHTWNPGGGYFLDQEIRRFEGLGFPGWAGTDG